ncbi:MAG: ureidoglycolate lyase [Candidatus Eremiobacteraeota bacterium]|nr:ureidoglycolate lyase [Candidatus Eremiobacteraeota bacterium]
MSELILRAAALTREAFAPFGDVIEIQGRDSRWINENTCRRFDDLALIDVGEAAGRPLLSIFEATPRTLPLRIGSLERHPLSSQAFYPLQGRPFLVVVAVDGRRPKANGIRAFLSSGTQGVNYRRNTWHHPLIAIAHVSTFLVVDRGGPGDNCEERSIEPAVLVCAE